jgi:hypothetical protein
MGMGEERTSTLREVGFQGENSERKGTINESGGGNTTKNRQFENHQEQAKRF